MKHIFYFKIVLENILIYLKLHNIIKFTTQKTKIKWKSDLTKSGQMNYISSQINS